MEGWGGFFGGGLQQQRIVCRAAAVIDRGRWGIFVGIFGWDDNKKKILHKVFGHFSC